MNEDQTANQIKKTAGRSASEVFGPIAQKRFGTVLADPPWRFRNATGKVAPGHRRLNRYETMSLEEIARLPVSSICADTAHLYLWCPNAILPDGLYVLRQWGFTYKTYIVWHKIRKDGKSDGRGVGFYYRNSQSCCC